MFVVRVLSVLSLLVVGVTAKIALADGPIDLTAANGQTIHVYFGWSKQPDNGNSAATYVHGIHIEVDGGIPGVTKVVLNNNCFPSSRYVFAERHTYLDCDYGSDGVWVPYGCDVKGNGEEILSRKPYMTIWAMNHGGQLFCSQEVAAAPTVGSWLEVPNSNGKHNFDLDFMKYIPLH